MANILVVDDAKFIRRILKDILTTNGHNVIGEAENGLKAIKLYKELKPDILIIDIIMPEIDGICAMKEIKRIDKDAKIIICSSMVKNNLFFNINLTNLGFDCFINKPFSPEDVMIAINKINK